MAILNADLSGTTYNNFETIPEGKYTAQIIDSGIVQSKNGHDMLNIQWEVTEGEYRGRRLFDRLMLSGSDQAVAIGRSRLRGIAEAIHHVNPNFVRDSSELHGKPCQIKVKIEPGKDGYEDQNRLTSFSKLLKDTPAASQPNPAPTVPQAAPAFATAVPPPGPVATTAAASHNPDKMPWEMDEASF